MNKFWGITIGAGLVVILSLYWFLTPKKEPAPKTIQEEELAVAPRPSGPKDDDLIPDPEDLIAKSTAEQARIQEETGQQPSNILPSGELSIPTPVIAELKKCLGGKAGIDSVNSSDDLFKQLGEPIKTRERWVDWSFKVEGKERRVHWENVEDDSGKVRPTLMVFDLDEKGDPVPYPMDARDQEEPTQEYVDNLLGQGQSLQKETSNLKEYAGGIHLEYLEKNGQLKEIEFERDNIFFRCDQVNQANTCHCFN